MAEHDGTSKDAKQHGESDPRHRESDEERDDRRNYQFPIVRVQAQAPIPVDVGDKPYQEKTYRIALANLILTGFTLFVLGVYTVTTIGLYQKASEANDNARAALEIQNRAWVIARDLKVARFAPTASPNEKLIVFAPLNNFGNSPAFDVEVLGGGRIVDDIGFKCPLEGPPVPDKCGSDVCGFEATAGLIPPKPEIPTIAQIPTTALTVADVEDVMAERRYFFVWAEILYGDMFADRHTRPRRTTFCMRLDPTIKGFAFAGNGNDAK